MGLDLHRSSVRRDAPLRNRSQVQIQIVIVGNALGHGQYRLAGTGVIVLLDPGAFQIVIEQVAQRVAGERIFQPFAGGGPVIVLPGGQQQQKAVVLLGGTQPPGLEHLVGVALHGVVADVIDGIHANLGTAGLLQGAGKVCDVGFGVTVQDVGVIRHAAGGTQAGGRRCTHRYRRDHRNNQRRRQ